MASQNPEFSSQADEKQNSTACIQRMRPVLGTFCSIQAMGKGVNLERAIDAAFDAIRLVNDLMHPVHGVDIVRINQSSQPIQIHEWTWQVLCVAKHLNVASNRIFDPCLPTQQGCMRDIELLPDNQLICHAPVLLDLGGIAKGYAVDCAIDVLIRAGCTSALVNAGGDIRVMGEPQVIHISYANQMIPVTLNQQALAVSDVENASRPAQHRGYYLRNNANTIVHKFAAVVSDRAVIADALAKCVMWSDIDASTYLCQQFNSQLIIAD